MERFWLTMRRQVLDFCDGLSSLHDVQVRIHAWLDTHYHRAPHAGLMGKTSSGVYAPDGRDIEAVDDDLLKKALIVTETRKVRRDTTISVEGTTYELDRGWLQKYVTTGRDQAAEQLMGSLAPNMFGAILPQCHPRKARFYRQLCVAIGVNPKATAASVFYEVTQHVEQLAGEQRHPITVHVP